MSEHSPIHIVLAGGRKLLREGLTLLLEKHGDLKVIAEGEDASTAVKLARTLPCDVLVLSESAIATIGIEQIAAIRRAQPELGIVVSALNPPVQWVRNVVNAGVTACLTKECAAAELVAAIRA